MEYIIDRTPKNYFLFVAHKLQKINHNIVQSRKVLYTNIPEDIGAFYLD